MPQDPWLDAAPTDRTPAEGAPRTAPEPEPAEAEATPATPVVTLPAIARVRVEAARDRVVVIEDLDLSRDDSPSGGLEVYAAFGAPGTPIAVDAHLLPLPAGALEASVDEVGDPVPVVPAVGSTPHPQLLLGRPTMAGVVVHILSSALRHAAGSGRLAALRIRSLLDPPLADSQGARDVLVRLGVAGERPLTLGRIEVVSTEPGPWIRRVEAHLCGPDANASQLAVTLTPAPPTAPPASPPVVAPSAAVRHASDDLCIRWWAAP